MELLHHRVGHLGRSGQRRGQALMRHDAAHAGALALVLLSLYAASAPRTVAFEDDAFFILASHFAGVAHPPGYPLHTLLGKLASLLPVGSAAYRVHMLSAACGAGACAALWLCARALSLGRIGAWLAALGLGVSPAFWSQAIIAEVYTLNALLFFLLVLLALRRASLAAIGLVFGLSLANHWPLMLLCTPALVLLLWPRRAELLGRLPRVLACVCVGLLPYAWMVWQSRSSPIAFYGPIESLQEFWFYVSRQGYAQADASPTGTWGDRGHFAAFLVREALAQLAVAGTVLAAAGFAAQWAILGRRLAVALTFAFVMPSFFLLFLLRFDYDVLHQNVIRVYPLPAYGILALWMGLGLEWLGRRLAWGASPKAAAAGVLALAILGVGAWRNVRAGYDWSERYARAVLEALPRDANLVLFADADIGPISYLHLVEGMRPDVTLYHSQGLLLGSRLFHPMRTSAPAMRGALRSLAQASKAPTAFMHEPPEGMAQRHHGFFVTVDASSAASPTVIDLSPAVLRFVEDAVLAPGERDGWTRLVQQRLRERFGEVIAASVVLAPDLAAERVLRALGEDYAGALGIAQGTLAARGPLRDVARALDRAREGMPGDAPKAHRAKYFELRAYLRLEQGDRGGAMRDLEAAVEVWPAPGNRAAFALSDLRLGQAR
jgi:hypothetical protein